MNQTNLQQTTKQRQITTAPIETIFNEEEDMQNNFEYEIKLLESDVIFYENESLKKKRKKPVFCQHYKWTEYEDNLLRQLVSKFGENDWRHLAKKFDGRNSRQCRERWKYYLNPDLKVGNWTEEEDDLIIEKRDELGPKWMKISKFFQNRTDAMIKNRYKYLIKNGKKKPKNKRFLPQNNTSNNFANEIEIEKTTNDESSDNKMNLIHKNKEDENYLKFLDRNENDEDGFFQNNDFLQI